jgi:hypothetical protein
MPADNAETERRFPRRFLLAASGAAVATGAAQAVASPASAAPGSTPWQLGGNGSVSSDGTNFLGPTNGAPLIFKTKPPSGAIRERLRISSNGHIGVGMSAPVAQFDLKSTAVTGINGTSTNPTSSATGVQGTGDNGAGVRGNSASNYGVFGTGGYCGVRGQGGTYGSISSGTSVGGYGSGSDYGLYGAGGSYGLYAGGSTYGVYGSGPTGVFGSGSTYGVSGTTTNLNTDAVRGSGGQYGVHGLNARTAGTRGDSGYVGAWGQANLYGVYGLATDGSATSYGVFGQASNASSYGVWCQGNMHVTGTLSKAAGSFKIDHPLDPKGKWLSHSFVESPDMMNVYNGNAVLDGRGEATVALPDYFTALTRDFRYQLTPIGAHAPVYVAGEVDDNEFRIAGGTPGLKVSWQVTGIRQDTYAAAHPIVVETAKSRADHGTQQFVPAGSSAKPMRVGPAQPAESEPATETELIPLPAIRK